VIEVYTPDDEFVVGENGTLTGGDVLPGFSVAVRDLFQERVTFPASLTYF